jgi:hypothetical protein
VSGLRVVVVGILENRSRVWRWARWTRPSGNSLMVEGTAGKTNANVQCLRSCHVDLLILISLLFVALTPSIVTEELFTSSRYFGAILFGNAAYNYVCNISPGFLSHKSDV